MSLQSGPQATVNAAEAMELLGDLENNVPDQIKRVRSSARVRVKSKVVAQPGNSSDRLAFTIQGVTGDVSSGGCQILFPIPLNVGDIYWLTFDNDDLPIGAVFARCLRCRLIREDAYEAGFKFLERVELSLAEHDTKPQSDLNKVALFD